MSKPVIDNIKGRLTLWEENSKVVGEINHKCNWQEGYYGYECVCGNFIPYGCEPWVPTDDEVHEMLIQLHKGGIQCLNQ